MTDFDLWWDDFTSKHNVNVPPDVLAKAIYRKLNPKKCKDCEKFEKITGKDYGYCVLLKCSFDKNGYCSLVSK
jgi:hypothetical protein